MNLVVIGIVQGLQVIVIESIDSIASNGVRAILPTNTIHHYF